jgi:hypothetical protein
MTDSDEHLRAVFETGEVVQLHRDNTGLYTFWGRLSMYDHVCIGIECESENPEDGETDLRLIHVFRGDDKFDALVELVQTHQFPQYLNQNEVHPVDLDAFVTSRMADIEASLGAD